MDFKKKGWFKKYINFREENPFEEKLPTSGLLLKNDGMVPEIDQEIYCFLQPTGILYGFPFSNPFRDVEYPNYKYFDKGDKAQLIFLESMFACLVADKAQHKGPVEQPETFPRVVDHSLKYFVRHHRANQPNWFTKLKYTGKNLLHDIHYRFEEAFRRRIHFDLNLVDFTDYFHNSMIFLDLFYCLQEQREGKSAVSQRNIRKTLLEIMTVAAHANGKIETQENKLFEQFLQSSHLPGPLNKKLRRGFREGMELKDIEIPELPWLVRRYFLELAQLTVMADHKVEDAEKDFLGALSEKLQMDENDQEQSQTALETFLLQHENELRLLNHKPRVYNISQRLQERALKTVVRNKDRLMREFAESRELMELLAISRTRPLTDEEKEKVRVQLFDILKTIPVFVIIALPGTFITLPIMLKVLPEYMYPTAFRE